MYLKSLVLRGFKSFADRSELRLEPGITAVVGPNGSGKSNISDAILWVLGERNAKNLRGQVMEDVIFAGSGSRKSVSVAQVDLVLDNSDGELPVDYSEVTISRRMFRDGLNEYLINGSVVRRMDILDILHDSGLGTGTHSIISQGNLDSILQSKPEDRRALIEEAAGVLKHKQRKEKSQHKLDLMDQHLDRARDVVAEVERQVGPLERKAKRAIAYKEVRAELDDLSLKLAVDDLRRLQKKWDKACEDETAFSAQLEAQRCAIDEAEAEAERLQAILQQQTSDAVDVSNKARRLSLYQQRFESMGLLIAERKRSAQERIDSAKSHIDSLASAGDAQTVEVEQLSLLEEVNTKKNEADVLVAQAVSAYDEQVEQRVAAEQRVFELLEMRTQTESDLQALKKAQASAQQSVELNANKISVFMENAEEAQLQLQQAQSEYDATSAQAEGFAEELTEAQQSLEKTREEYDDARKAKQTLRQNVQSYEDVVRALEIEIAGLQELEKLSSNAGASAQWMTDCCQERSLQRLADLLDIDEGYEPYVDMVLGSDASLMVVPKVSDAEAIGSEFLKAGIDGRVELGLEPAVGVTSADQARKMGDALFDHVRVTGGFDRLCSYLLGNVVIVDDYKSALKAFSKAPCPLCFVGKDRSMVTPAGKVLFAAGEYNKMSGSVARKKRLTQAAQEIDNARKSAEEAAFAYEKVSKSTQALEQKMLDESRSVAALEGNLDATAKARNAAQERVDALTRKKDTLLQQAEQLREASRQAEQSATELNAKIDQTQQRLSEVDDEQKRAQEVLNPIRVAETKALEALNTAKLDLARISERHTYIQQGIESNRAEIARKEQELRDAQTSISLQTAVLARIDAITPLLDNLARAAKAHAEMVDKQIMDSKDSSNNSASLAAQARSRAREARDVFNATNEKLSSVRVDKGRLEIQVGAAINTITQDCHTSLETALKLEELEHRDEVEELAGKLRRRIINMGTINPDAAAEYEKVKTRYDFLNAQLHDLTEARSSLAKISRVIEARMKDDFIITFNTVNENFQEIFAILFPGGNGRLDLCDPNDLENTGVEVVAQPKGKRITKMMLMSGGEKSLVALALLFAVYKTRTTPFYVLDEVEAALDDSNLRRLVHYLENLRTTTQLIMITHQRRTMEMADVLFGISMGSDGVTKVISQKLDHALRYAEE